MKKILFFGLSSCAVKPRPSGRGYKALLVAVGQTVLACGEGALATSLKQEPVENREVLPLQVAI